MTLDREAIAERFFRTFQGDFPSASWQDVPPRHRGPWYSIADEAIRIAREYAAKQVRSLNDDGCQQSAEDLK